MRLLQLRCRWLREAAAMVPALWICSRASMAPLLLGCFVSAVINTMAFSKLDYDLWRLYKVASSRSRARRDSSSGAVSSAHTRPSSSGSR